jgi:23S rRNA (cytosine1962-C5)-methyltransferase
LSLLTGCSNIYERSDAAVRSREGLPERTGPVAVHSKLSTLAPTQVQEFAKPIIQEDGVSYQIDIAQGHKTGFYVDQRENRLLVRQLCERLVQQGRAPRVLNCFSYTGGFSLAAVKGGAQEVISVDSSADALNLATQNAALNNIVNDRFICLTANVFDDLKKRQNDHDPGFDIVVLDPPKFAPSAHHVDKAARAYKDLNMRGLRLLKPGGYLLTFSCSGAISVDLFQKIVAGAIVDARVDCQLLQRLAAGDDHPMSMVHPEGEYLKGLLLRRD